MTSLTVPEDAARLVADFDVPSTSGVGTLDAALASRGFAPVLGADECGRGALLGPLVAAAVVLPAGWVPDGLDDSKRLSAVERLRLHDEIVAVAHVATVEIPAGEVDRLGVHSANMWALARAAAQVLETATRAGDRPCLALIDGFRLPGSGLEVPHARVVKGDRCSASIAAASVVAKVVHDRRLADIDARFGGYGAADHQGYGTPQHLAALARLGPCPEHRRSFAPVARLLQPPLAQLPGLELAP